MKGGILLRVNPPAGQGPSTVRLFYVAETVSRTYLSLATLKALGIVEMDFPRIQTRQPPASTHPHVTVTQETSKSLGNQVNFVPVRREVPLL